MKKWITRSLAVMICLFVFAGIAATEAKAADVIIQGDVTDSWNNDLFYSYVLDSDGVLTLSGYDLISAYEWQDYKERVKTVIIESGVKSIGPDFFADCEYLTSVSIPGTVTEIGSSAFKNCMSLTSVSIPSKVTAIGYNAFNGCTRLTGIDLPDGVTEIGSGAFAYSGLTSITIPRGLKEIDGYVFRDCTSLKTVKFNNALETIGWNAFLGCEALSEVQIPASVTAIEDCAFQKCAALKEIVIPKTVAAFGGSVFAECTGLTKVTFEEGCHKVPDGIFAKCSNLVSVNLPDSLMEIGSDAFGGCTKLQRVDLPSKLTTIDYWAFSYCESLMDIVLPDSLLYINFGAFSNCTSLTEIELPDSLLEIGGSAFADCTSLRWITIPASVKTIGDGAFSNYVFDSYDALDGVTFLGDVPDAQNAFGDTVIRCYYPAGNKSWNNVDAEHLGKNVFLLEEGEDLKGTCGSKLSWVLTEDNVLTISGKGVMPAYTQAYNGNAAPWNDVKKFVDKLVVSSGVNNIGSYAFYNCKNMKSASIADSVKKIDADAFSWCEALEEVNIPASVVEIGEDAFAVCSKLKSISIPNGVTSIGAYAFVNCDSLTSVVIPDSVTSMGKEVFSNCDNLSEATIGKNITYISRGTFDNCEKLTSVSLPNSLDAIGGEAFYNCASLESITIPAAVTEILDDAFAECIDLENVYFTGDAPWIDNSAFTNVYATAYYPAGNATWTSDKRLNYGGQIKWVSEKNVVLTAPELTKISNASSGVTLTWNKVNDAAKYQVFVKTSQSGAWSKVATTSKTSYTYTKAESNKIYYMTVKAVDSTGTIVSDCNETGLKIRFLSQPVLSKISNTTSGVKLTWNKVTGATEYQILAKTSKSGSWKKVTTTSETSYTYTNVESGKYCYMTVKAVKGTTASTYDTTGLNIRFLSRPTLSKIATTSNGVKLTWNKVTGATEYQVLAKTSKSGTWKKVATTSSTSYTYKAESGKYCYMTVKAVNGSSVSTYNSTGLNVKFLSQPTISKLSNTSKGIKISWGKVSGAQKYQVLVKTSQNGTWKSVGTTTKTDVTYTKAQSGKTYYFSVKAIADDGKTVSTYSSTGTKLLFLSQPEITKLKNTSKGVSVTWEASQGAGQYKVYVKTSKDGDWTSVGTTSKTSFTYTKAKSGKTYYFSVRALDKDGKIASSYDTAGMKIQFKK